jgi:membrane protein DedA with SNARE-associated domain
VSISEQLLGDLSLYGMPVLFGVTFISGAGIPLPTSLLLIAAGSFADHGEMNAGAVIAVATLGVVLGDQIGYGIGRWGDRALADRVSRWMGGEDRLTQAEAHARKWGGVGIFLTRWLVTPLGPFINIASGFANYPWHRFLLWDVVGEVLWVALYVGLGVVFSHRVQALSSLLGNVTWAVLALVVAVALAWKLMRSAKSTQLVH